ncbi:MAG: DUF6788 family protein [Bryobacteraceae bacterium]
MASRLSRADLSATERGLRSRIVQIASGERFLHGTLSERSSKCGKPNCRCANGEGHASLYLVRSGAGTVRQLCIPKALQDPVRQAVGEFQEMQRLLQEVSELEWQRFLARKGRPFSAA